MYERHHVGHEDLGQEADGWGDEDEIEGDMAKMPFYEPGSQLKEWGLAHHLRHSPVTLGCNVVILVLITFLLAWVVMDPTHNPRSVLYWTIEAIVTTAVVFDLVTEVMYVGWQNFVRGTDGKGARSAAANSGQGHQQPINPLRCFCNWFQVILTFFCVVALLYYLFGSKGDPGSGETESMISLALLLVRYVVYVGLLAASSRRTMNMQGCCHKKEDWDVKGYTGPSIWDDTA